MSLESIIANPELAGTSWSIAVAPLGGPAEQVNASSVLRTASVAKIFILIEVARRLADGTIAEGSVVARDRVAPVADSGLWQHLRVPALAVEDAAKLVGVVSDNWATNALLDVVGLPSVQAVARELAPGGSQLLDQVRDVRDARHPPALSVGCAADWVRVMTGLWQGSIVSEAVSARVLDWLAGGLDLSMVTSAFGLDPLAHASGDRGYRVWSKTGTDAGVRADVGVVQSPDGVVAYAAISNWDPSTDAPRDAVLAAMRSIGQRIRTTLRPSGPGFPPRSRHQP